MNVLILDQNAKYYHLINSLLSECLSKKPIIEYARYLCEAREVMEKKAIQLIITDLSLPDGRGADILEYLSQYPTYVICLASNAKYAVEAVRFNNVKDFLIKPIDIGEFKQSLERFELHSISRSDENTILDQNSQKKLKYNSNHAVEFIDLENIVRVEAMRSYCRAILKNNRSIVYSKSLSKIEQELPKNQFFRVHKSHLINLSHVESVQKSGGVSIRMNDETSIPISRDKKKNFFSTFEYFIH